MMRSRILLIVFFIAAAPGIFGIIPMKSSACVGARALALGGAFSGVADDTQATYWNPAGLTRANPGIVTMHNLNFRNNFNYDDYIGLSFCKRNWGLGFEYINESTDKEESDWLQIGGAFALSEISFGLNVRHLYLKGEGSGIALDLGMLTQFGPIKEEGGKRMFSAGIMVQDLNRQEISGREYNINIRPGFGFRPINHLLLSIEIYDATCNFFKKPQMRIGYEWAFPFPYLPGHGALRGGLYHLNERKYKAFTGGIGYLYPISKTGAVGFDYAFMWWEKSNTLIHLLGLIYKF